MIAKMVEFGIFFSGDSTNSYNAYLEMLGFGVSGIYFYKCMVFQATDRWSQNHSAKMPTNVYF